jgi:dCTP deaminase
MLQIFMRLWNSENRPEQLSHQKTRLRRLNQHPPEPAQPKMQDTPLQREGVFRNINYYRSRLKPPLFVRTEKTVRFGRSMSIQSDRWIREQATQQRMIEPFSERQVHDGVISYGLSSYGYDLRVSDEFKIFTNVNSAIIDPKAFDERSFVSVQAESVIVPPNSFALARSIEYFRIPRDVLTICVGKSTYARCGIIVNVTPFEPEWEGFVTLEISNTTPLPARIYANEGLCQILFFRSDEVCEISYADRKGKYQKQQGIVLPKL